MSRKLSKAEKMLAIKAGVEPDTVELCDVCVGCNFPGDCPKLGADVVEQEAETEAAETPTEKPEKITAMLLSVAETVGLTQEEILACKDKESLVAAIKTKPPNLKFI